MDIKFLEFSRAVDRTVTDASTRGRIIAVAVGIAISRKINLPSLALEVEPSNYFNAQMAMGANEYISKFNEEVVFDTRYCREAVRTFWLMRYAAAYGEAQFHTPPNLGFVDSVAGATLYLAPDMHEFCSANKEAIFAVTREALCLVDCTQEDSIANQAASSTGVREVAVF